MGSEAADHILEIAFLAVIGIVVAFLFCYLICKIREYCDNRSKVILKDQFGKNHMGENNYKIDAVNFVDQLPRSTRMLVIDHSTVPEKDENVDKPIDKSVDKSDIIKNVFSLEVDPKRVKKRKFHQTINF